MLEKIPKVTAYLTALQENISAELEAVEKAAGSPACFIQDNWLREGNLGHLSHLGGGGRSRGLRSGACFEGAGIKFSHVRGESLPASATAHRAELVGRGFEALGVSGVFHPLSPFVPTVHMNVRLFVAEKKGEEPLWWFGGGMDLTPYYAFEEDCQHFHQVAKQACSAFGPDIYPTYKKWADRYFYLPHRQEARGIGGLFFDDLNQSIWGWDFNKCFDFLRAVGDNFLKAYLPILQKNQHKPYTQAQKAFQLYRRGRYVEFNLLYDRGTLFGLQSGGRTESILMSLPPTVSWLYNFHPEPGSPEAELCRYFLVPKDWV